MSSAKVVGIEEVKEIAWEDHKFIINRKKYTRKELLEDYKIEVQSYREEKNNRGDLLLTAYINNHNDYSSRETIEIYVAATSVGVEIGKRVKKVNGKILKEAVNERNIHNR